MKITAPSFSSDKLSFPKASVSSTIYAFDENREFAVILSQSDRNPAEVRRIFAAASNPPENASEAEIERAKVDLLKVKVLFALAAFNSTFLGIKQLSAYLSMREGEAIKENAIRSALSSLIALDLVEKTKIKDASADKDIMLAYKLTKAGSDAVAENFSVQDMLFLSDGERLNADFVVSIPAWKVQENLVLAQFITEAFKFGFVSSVDLPAFFPSDVKRTEIRSSMTVKDFNAAEKTVFIFAPRRQNGWKEYLLNAVERFSESRRSDKELPKLLLICENTEAIYETAELLRPLFNDVELIFTDDIAPLNDFSTAFSLFDENETEIALIAERKSEKKQSPSRRSSGGRAKSKGKRSS